MQRSPRKKSRRFSPRLRKRWPTRSAAESIDFLDMVFRLERAFKIKIPRGKIIENARGDMPESEFEQKGVLTLAGLAQLRRYLSEIPAERFGNPMKVADIPRLFTPETFCKLVIQSQREAPAAA